VLEFATSSFHHRSCRPDRAGLKARIQGICAAVRVRYGYRRVQVLLRREGWQVNRKRTYRLCKELGLQLRNKTPKRHVRAKLREDRQLAVRPNEVWAMDLVHDQLATGRKIRALAVVDTFSRFSPVLDARFSDRSEDVVRTLDGACRMVGYPRTIRVRSSYPGISISGRTPGAPRSTSPVPGSRPTMPSRGPSTAERGRRASMRTGS
jgi:putative transposase